MVFVLARPSQNYRRRSNSSCCQQSREWCATVPRAPFPLHVGVARVHREFDSSEAHYGGDGGRLVYLQHHPGQWLHDD